MGSPKPLLDFDGRSALELVLDAGAAGGAAESVIVAPMGLEEKLSAALPRSSARGRIVVNPDPGSEQIRSLQLALETILGERPGGFFIHPVDYPLALAEDYRLLLEAFRSSSDGSEVFIPSHERRRGHPILCAGALVDAFLRLPPGGTARVVIASAKVAHVPTRNAGVLEDMDTRADYERLLESYRARASR
jgi:CTP:molybdopterin cytidylyltransferase MocA